MTMSQSNNHEISLSNAHLDSQYLEDLQLQERFSRNMKSKDSLCDLFKTMTAMGINVDLIRKDGSTHTGPPPPPPPQSPAPDPFIPATREMDMDDYITFYTYGSKNLASRGFKSSCNREINNLKQDSLKQISNIIQSTEVDEELTEKGEIISHLFEKQLLAKLDASGNINEYSATTAKTTAMKFAKWVEEILSECEKRKNLRKIMENQQFGVAALNNMEDVISIPMQFNTTAIETEMELVKINEISDEEIEKRFGESLSDSSKHVLFHFESPNRQPKIVVHLLSDSSMKEMIVREMSSDDKWSNWLIEVGSMENTMTPGIGMKHAPESKCMRRQDKSESFGKKTELVSGKAQEVLKHSKFEWDAKAMENIFGSRDYYGKIPILKRQCVSTTNDFAVEYPIYHPKFSGSFGAKLFDFEGTEIIFPIPPHHDHTDSSYNKRNTTDI